ncbi:Arc family DNA-binding protein [Salmonella enterica]|uniref:Arc family DNA-binding protein n=1 Tax=Salmonella enterica TaxID=28901 RepID=UPI0009B15EBA|nr:Arc family DNA-binding protein [Salmonella enterica]ECB3807374.1 Arc family DNA-binding protein [Salmonella enterica subsp. enterica serovar Fufu]EDU3844883.1 Arc family DNA-binding protein [Salmonella enterica subsp. enterica serovar Essen]EJN2863896.1 Arc family DNA-binding protein [Salmonella enterica subsp. enterica serovar Yaba]HAK9055133.1 Arc family DNA-binding protein [Salmonella enterica]HCL5132400.1 Arc family DNA-binding protein [Salmonella enterica]
MSREDPQMKIRLPVELKDEIAERARRNGRSMNAEIIAYLKYAIRYLPMPDDDPLVIPLKTEDELDEEEYIRLKEEESAELAALVEPMLDLAKKYAELKKLHDYLVKKNDKPT